MAYKLMYIPNNNTQNYPFCRLQLMVETYGQWALTESINQNLVKVPKVVKSTNKKSLL